VTKDEPKDKDMTSTPRDVTTAVAGTRKLLEQGRQNIWLFPANSEGSVRKNYRRVTIQAGSQERIKQNIFFLRNQAHVT